MTENERRPVTSGAARGSSTATDATTVPQLRRYGWRARRRLAVARALDRSLRPAVDPWTYSEPIDYRAVHLDRTLVGRDEIGRELAVVS